MWVWDRLGLLVGEGGDVFLKGGRGLAVRGSFRRRWRRHRPVLPGPPEPPARGTQAPERDPTVGSLGLGSRGRGGAQGGRLVSPRTHPRCLLRALPAPRGRSLDSGR